MSMSNHNRTPKGMSPTILLRDPEMIKVMAKAPSGKIKEKKKTGTNQDGAHKKKPHTKPKPKPKPKAVAKAVAKSKTKKASKSKSKDQSGTKTKNKARSKPSPKKGKQKAQAKEKNKTKDEKEEKREEKPSDGPAPYPVALQTESIASRLLRWFEQEDVLDKKVESEGYSFHFKLTFNNKSYQCFQPSKAPDKVVLFTRTKISPDHQSALSAIDGHDRDELYWKLNFAFVDKAAFALKKDELGVLYEFQLSKVIYQDGLTKHQLLRDLRTLHAANLAGTWHLQRNLGPGGDTFSSKVEDVLRPEMYH